MLAAVRQAVYYGLSDLGRLETMVLRAIAGDFFRLPVQDDDFPPMSKPKDEDQGEDDVYDPKDTHEDAPQPGAAASGGSAEPEGPGGGGEPEDADATTDGEHDLVAGEHGGGDGHGAGDDERDRGGGDGHGAGDDERDRGGDEDLDLEIVVEDDEHAHDREQGDGDDGSDDDAERG